MSILLMNVIISCTCYIHENKCSLELSYEIGLKPQPTMLQGQGIPRGFGHIISRPTK